MTKRCSHEDDATDFYSLARAVLGATVARDHGIKNQGPIGLNADARSHRVIPVGQLAIHPDAGSRAIPAWIGRKKTRLV